MVKINHDCTCEGNPLVPHVCRIIQITDETADVKTFRAQTLDGRRPFLPRPGQLGMWSLPGIGEAMFSITAYGDDWVESSVKVVGELTEAMHELSVGDCVGLRGPYGNGFPVEALKGSNILFVGGGIGAAPVRSVIRWCVEHRADYGKLDIVVGSRTVDDTAFKEDFFENWPRVENTSVHITVDRKTDNWNGNVGFVPDFVEQIGVSTENCKVVLCGPPIMIKLTTERLAKLGFAREDIITSLETRMKCGIGKCGRCNIGSKYICLDGPVFLLSELDELPAE